MDVRLNVSYEQVNRSQKVCVSGPKCSLFFNVVICTTISHNIGHLVFSHCEQFYRTQKVCVSGPIFIGFFSLVLVGTTASQNIRHFFNTLYMHRAINLFLLEILL